MTVRASFQPKRGANVVTTPAAGSASISIDAQCKSVRLVNSGANICHVRIGSGAQTATTADMPIRAGAEIIVSKGDGDDTLAHISAAGTTLHVQPGEGGS
jgi:hypothetical protein